jgi:hypothetical protein
MLCLPGPVAAATGTLGVDNQSAFGPLSEGGMVNHPGRNRWPEGVALNGLRVSCYNQSG